MERFGRPLRASVGKSVGTARRLNVPPKGPSARRVARRAAATRLTSGAPRGGSVAPNYPLRRLVALSGVLALSWGGYLGATGICEHLASGPADAAVALPALSSRPGTPAPPVAAVAAEGASSASTERPQATTPPSATPFKVKGIVVVSKFHPLTRAYVPDTARDRDGLRPEVRDALMRMVNDAKAQKLTIAVRSGYRSFAVQEASWKRAYAKYGEDAHRYYAEAGHSEHQTGLAVDLSDGKHQNGDDFANTPQARWVAKNAFRYGFIVRYPEGKQEITGVDYEPWHVRYVGVDVATDMARTPGITLEEYLGLA